MPAAKPSITYWNRVEPTPRSDSLARGLEAAVRDPAWFLARQWQMGEFKGEDAGSPSVVSFQARVTRFKSWSPEGGDERPFEMQAPLEALAENEEVSPNWQLAVELGQLLERMLTSEGAAQTTFKRFRSTYPIPAIADLSADERRDEALVRFLRVCGGRGVDGVRALQSAKGSAPGIPVELNISSEPEQGRVTSALTNFVAWVTGTYGAIGRSDAPSWQPARLDYGIKLRAETPQESDVVLRAEAGSNGDFEWYAFDQVGAQNASGVTTETIALSLLPTNVNFSGMPNSRWWQFEDARFNWTNVDVDRREIGKTMLLDFMLVQGNDWFLVPFGQPVGSLITVDQLVVRDVFGDHSLVQRADGETPGVAGRWTMFSTLTEDGSAERLADYFILPPSALRTTLDGPDLEEVRFLRDEQSNLVWGVEAKTENGIGVAWSGHERALGYPDQNPAATSAAPLRYRLQTPVPVHWIPFPPVQIDTAHRAVALERAAMERFVDGEMLAIHPKGRVLDPTHLDSERYRINEEEVSRSGTRILRAAHRTRWVDGTTHVWISRRRRAGMGEGASGLRYDLAERSSNDEPEV